MAFCKHCGKELNTGSRFCKHCGKEQPNIQTTSAQSNTLMFEQTKRQKQRAGRAEKSVSLVSKIAFILWIVLCAYHIFMGVLIIKNMTRYYISGVGIIGIDPRMFAIRLDVGVLNILAGIFCFFMFWRNYRVQKNINQYHLSLLEFIPPIAAISLTVIFTDIVLIMRSKLYLISNVISKYGIVNTLLDGYVLPYIFLIGLSLILLVVNIILEILVYAKIKSNANALQIEADTRKKPILLLTLLLIYVVNFIIFGIVLPITFGGNPLQVLTFIYQG